MLKTIAEFEIPTVDLGKYRKEIRDYLKKEQLEAIKKWLIKILERTPTYTGAARYTYGPVGRKVKHFVRAGSPGSKNDSRRKNKKTFVYGGKRYSLDKASAETYQEHKILAPRSRGNKIRASFSFSPKLPYVIWNDFQKGPAWMNLIRATPWKALQGGREAYLRHANGPMVKGFPLLRKRMKVKRIRTK